MTRSARIVVFMSVLGLALALVAATTRGVVAYAVGGAVLVATLVVGLPFILAPQQSRRVVSRTRRSPT